jgi:hypothetical protein
MTTLGSIRNAFPARIPPPHPTIDWISCEPLHRNKITISNIGPCNNEKCTMKRRKNGAQFPGKSWGYDRRCDRKIKNPSGFKNLDRLTVNWGRGRIVFLPLWYQTPIHSNVWLGFFLASQGILRTRRISARNQKPGGWAVQICQCDRSPRPSSGLSCGADKRSVAVRNYIERPAYG